MSYETALNHALLTLCPRVFPVNAPFGTAMPYVIWQRAGGLTVRTIGNHPAGDLRNGRVSISVWASTPKRASDLMRSIEDAMAAQTAIRCIPQEEASDIHDDGGSDVGIYGMQQTFSIWAKR